MCLLPVYLLGYNGKKKFYSWHSISAEVYFLGQACREAGFPAAWRVIKSRGSSYHLNESKKPVKIHYAGKEMFCEIDMRFGGAAYEPG